MLGGKFNSFSLIILFYYITCQCYNLLQFSLLLLFAILRDGALQNIVEVASDGSIMLVTFIEILRYIAHMCGSRPRQASGKV